MAATLTRPVARHQLTRPIAPQRTPRDRPPPTIDDLTRRELLQGATALLVVAGCRTDRQPVAAPSPTAATRTIEHKYGSTEISGVPERVVTVGYTDQDAVLALGLTPVAVREWFSDRPPAGWPWQQDVTAADPEVLSFELDFEQIATLRPDLILGVWAGMTEDEYATLSQIAPTVAHASEYEGDPFLAPWQDRTRMIGRALGDDERADKLVAEVEAQFARARRQHPEFEGATAALVEGPIEGNFFTYTLSNPRALIFDELGFKIPEEIVELGEEEAAVIEVSAERLDLFDQDVLVWLGSDPALVMDTPLYDRLDAVREGRDLFADELLQGALAFGTVLSLPYAVDRLVPQLAAAIDGDLATEPTPASS